MHYASHDNVGNGWDAPLPSGTVDSQENEGFDGYMVFDININEHLNQLLSCICHMIS